MTDPPPDPDSTIDDSHPTNPSPPPLPPSPNQTTPSFASQPSSKPSEFPLLTPTLQLSLEPSSAPTSSLTPPTSPIGPHSAPVMPSTSPVSLPSNLINRRSAGRTSAPKRRASGIAAPGANAASHFSKPIEIPSAGLKIEPPNITRVDRVNSGGELAKTLSAAKDEPPLTSARIETIKGGNTLKKQITKVVPTIGKIAATGQHRKKVKDGEVVFKGHRNWEIVLSIQFGLRYTSELLEDSDGGEPTQKDYTESLAFDFNPVDEHRSVFDVNKYAKWAHPAPFVYRLIRKKFGLSEEEFLDSTCSESRVRELPTPGKSGALFYITDDEKYFMKTIQHVEEKMLVSMLPTYYRHVCNNPRTLLTKYMAHFSVQTRRDRHIRMVVMASIFTDQVFIDRKYDLKGSTYNRFASPEQLESENVTLKDQDFEDPVFFRPEVLKQIMDQLAKDSQFLESHSVMDYSLLLGLSDMLPDEDASYKAMFGPKEESAPYFVGYQKDKHGHKSGVRVCMGIIDFLQRFRLRKKVEYGCRVLQSCSCSSASVAPPHLYRERFMAFLQSRFLPDPDLDVSTLVTTTTKHHVPVCPPPENDLETLP